MNYKTEIRILGLMIFMPFFVIGFVIIAGNILNYTSNGLSGFTDKDYCYYKFVDEYDTTPYDYEIDLVGDCLYKLSPIQKDWLYDYQLMSA